MPENTGFRYTTTTSADRELPIREIIKIPTGTNKVHEDQFRASAILNKVLAQLERGDSHKTIIEMIRLCYNTDIINRQKDN